MSNDKLRETIRRALPPLNKFAYSLTEQDAEHIRAWAVDAIVADRERLIAWVVNRWHDEVANRPLVNVHRRSLDDAWRQMLRHLGVDDLQALGPTHDALLAEKIVVAARAALAELRLSQKSGATK